MATSLQLSHLKRHAVDFPSNKELARLIAPRLDQASLVLIGEASYGTKEFYYARAEITRHLIEHESFNAVIIEGDWPETFLVNRFVKGHEATKTAEKSLSGFQRFPEWMWRNHETLGFIEWLYRHNQSKSQLERVGFYGMDLYSLYSSITEVIQYLEKVDPKAAQKARDHYDCFDTGYVHPSQYGYSVQLGLHKSCEDVAVQQLVDLRQRALNSFDIRNIDELESQYCAEENARVVVNSESYYRGMFSDQINTWNVRDQHMAEGVDHLRSFLCRRGLEPKVVVWAHNSHVGDARATERADIDEINLGQLLRERYPQEVKIIGMSTYSGTVIAAPSWGAPWNLRMINEALPLSLESLMHSVGGNQFFIDLRLPEVREALNHPVLERAIGVIYRPETERRSHYFHAHVADQFDLLLHFDESRGVLPIDDQLSYEFDQEPPGTYPSGY